MRSTAACAGGVALGILLLVLARPDWRAVTRYLAPVNIFLLFLWLVTPFTVPGTPLLHWGPLCASTEGVHLALLVSLKANAIACIFLALMGSINVSVAGHALASLHCPDKLVFLLLLTARSVHLMTREWKVLFNAARLRGFRLRTSRHTYLTLASLLGLLLMRGHARAQRAQEAIRLRGFSGKFRSVAAFRARPADALFVLGLLAGMTALSVAEYLWRAHG